MQKRRRIFIAINLPPEIKKELAQYGKKFPDLPARWTPEDNLHITLEFLGEMYDHELPEAVERAKEMAAGLKVFEIHLNRIEYAPAGKIPFNVAQGKPPRMLWATGENVHVTLARISAFAWRQIEPEERPEVNESIDMPFTVESIEVMESELKKGGPVYTIIESFPLK